jgi:hypothetical protein
MLIRRVPTKIKYQQSSREKKSGLATPHAVGHRVSWGVYRGAASSYEDNSIAITRENTLGVGLSKPAGRLSVR